MTRSTFQSKVSNITQQAPVPSRVLEVSPMPVDAPEQLNKLDRVRGLVWKIAIATLLLMAVGSATRVMNAGLACPDWPLCYGQLVPTQQMNLQVFLEWFHRLDAALIGLSTLILVITTWWQRSSLPKWLPWAATFALSLIFCQGILGGLTVTELLRFDIVTAHLGTALLFFITLLAIGSALMPFSPSQKIVLRKSITKHSQNLVTERSQNPVTEHIQNPVTERSQNPVTERSRNPVTERSRSSKLARLGLTAAILVYLQSILGGLVGSQWALHQCFGSGELCAVMNSHLWGVIPASLATLSVVFSAWRTPGLHPLLRRLSNLIGCLLLGQIALGYATFKLHLQVESLTVTHHTLGASLVGTLVVFTVLAGRDAVNSEQ